MELFKKLIQENSVWDAQIVGKNWFCQNPGKVDCFKDYFDFCLKVASWRVEIETRTFFASEADLALNVFSEKCKLDESTLGIIQESRSKLVNVSNDINSFIQNQAQEEEDAVVKSNNEVLSKLAKLKTEMVQVDNQKQFDRVLIKMSELEDRLDKTLLTSDQLKLYNSLTKDFSSLVSKKMAEISHNEDTQYNKRAADSFKKAFDLFKANEDKYKQSESELYGLVSQYLFAFDAKRLFNECLVYYNHVYSYIFNKLDDSGKFRFTQFSFDTPKL
ncbi:MAG: hypothetical protein IJK41_07555 [Muribaculaceae bacterium]|nr:hypothetical protein [Muribaculaceae bacterium]